MNCTNAVGFLLVGLVLSIAPVAAPGLFPHAAVDGSSTRAIWVEVMGWVQIGLAGLYWLTPRARRNHPAMDSSAVAGPVHRTLADSEPMPVLVVERFRTPEPEGSVVLHGSHAELWRAFNAALRNDGDARQVAARLLQLARGGEDAPEAIAENVLPFDGGKNDEVETPAVGNAG